VKYYCLADRYIIKIVYKQTFITKVTKWHTQIAHMAKHMNMVGGPGPIGLT